MTYRHETEAEFQNRCVASAIAHDMPHDDILVCLHERGARVVPGDIITSEQCDEQCGDYGGWIVTGWRFDLQQVFIAKFDRMVAVKPWVLGMSFQPPGTDESECKAGTS